MKKRYFGLLLFGVLAHAQSGTHAVWSVLHSANPNTPILSTQSVTSVANPYASGGRERPSLSVFCNIRSSAVVEFRGQFQLAQPTGAVVIDGETLLVDWTLDKDRESMTASKSDVQSLAYKMSHGKQMLVFFQTTGGPSQTATFSLVGLQALMKRTDCN